jgi:arsenite-transporting ATPase
MNQEVVGLAMLERVADILYGDRDPTESFYHGKVQEVVREDSAHVLSIALPFVSKGQITLIQSGDELTIRVGAFKRNVILPRLLVGLTAQGAKFEGNRLRIRFSDTGKEKESP